MLRYCVDCGFGTTEDDHWEEHLIVKHTDKVVDALVTQALKEAAEIFTLERMYRL